MPTVTVKLRDTTSAGDIVFSTVAIFADNVEVTSGVWRHGDEERAFNLAEQACAANDALNLVDVARAMSTVLNDKNGHTNGAAPSPFTGVHSFTMAELIGKAPLQMEYLPLLGHDGVFVKGSTHLLASWWRVGKSETMSQACAEWLKAGHRIVWLTEEPEDPVWRDRCLELVDMFGHEVPWEHLRMVDVYGSASPAALLAAAVDGLEDIVILDTVYAAIGCEDEDKTAIVRKAIRPWLAGVRAAGKTLIGLVHHRKAAGEHGERISGSHALPSQFDIVLEMAPDKEHENRRLLSGRARRVRVPNLVLEMDDDGVVSVLSNSQAAGEGLDRLVIEALGGAGWLTTALVIMRVKASCSPSTVKRTLTKLARQGHVLREPPIGEDAKRRTVKWTLSEQQHLI